MPAIVRTARIKSSLKTSSGTIEVTTPRDRLGNFEPEMVEKRETIVAQSLEDKIVSLCSPETSLRGINAYTDATVGVGCDSITSKDLIWKPNENGVMKVRRKRGGTLLLNGSRRRLFQTISKLSPHTVHFTLPIKLI